MNKIESLIRSNEVFMDFVNGTRSCMEFRIQGVPIYIFKESIGSSFYYKLPYYENFDYKKVIDFMKQAIPVLSKLIEKEKEDRLYGSACIR